MKSQRGPLKAVGFAGLLQSLLLRRQGIQMGLFGGFLAPHSHLALLPRFDSMASSQME